MTSVLQDWVMELPLRAQGTLLTGIRGCDLAPKVPLECDPDDRSCSTGEQTPERQLVAFLRYSVLVPADPREVDMPGAWFQSSPPEFKPSQLMHYPLHWYSHVMHCFEVVGFGHPDANMSKVCKSIYHRMVTALHLYPETTIEYERRITEDRIVSGNVVS